MLSAASLLPLLLLWQKLGRCLRPQAGQLLHSGHGTQQEPLQVLLLVPPPVLWLLLSPVSRVQQLPSLRPKAAAQLLPQQQEGVAATQH